MIKPEILCNSILKIFLFLYETFYESLNFFFFFKIPNLINASYISFLTVSITTFTINKEPSDQSPTALIILACNLKLVSE